MIQPHLICAEVVAGLHWERICPTTSFGSCRLLAVTGHAFFGYPRGRGHPWTEEKRIKTMKDMKSMKIQKKSYSSFSSFMSFMLFMVEKKRGSPRRKSPRRQTAQNPAHARRARCTPTSESGSEFSNRPVVAPSLRVNRASLLFPKSCVESSGFAPPANFRKPSRLTESQPHWK